MGLFVSLIVLSTIAYFLFRTLRQFFQRPVRKSAVLITGCDSGFGFMTARKFALCGVKVFAGCLTEDGVNRLKNDEELNQAKCGLFSFQLDVTSQESVEKAFHLVQDQLNFEEVENFSLINNAGISDGFWFEMTTMEQFEKVVQVNCLGVVRVTKAFLPLVRKSPKTGARIINITSMYGGLTNAGFTSYSCSKFGAEGFSDALRLELKYVGIPVVTIQPSFARTGIVSEGIKRIEKIIKDTDPKILKSYPVDFAEKTRLGKAKIATISLEPDQIVETLWKAYIVSSPNNHYPVGAVAWFYSFLRILPSEVSDEILNALF
eukprot:TRINITY_DN5709_c0_g1_i2.p1 TRINITY_DN5709_c0_g1~~TRINITY_DN5709_c0_g1_i2.p1  ORF type:complete len:319 (-),score=60.85 TRINITY_DN5709_c0_g1_i2:40-996(-)